MPGRRPLIGRGLGGRSLIGRAGCGGDCTRCMSEHRRAGGMTVPAERRWHTSIQRVQSSTLGRGRCGAYFGAA